jgi:upstream-binding transcription factor
MCEGKPEKPPNSGYNLFSKEFLSGKKAFENPNRMQELSRHWKGLSVEKREQCNGAIEKGNFNF